MSTGHRSEAKPAAELYRMLGERDTNELYAKPVKLGTSHDIPYGGGVSVDGKTVYIDKKLYDQVMRGAVAVRGMTPRQIIQAWIEHEHTEWSIDAGDNPADSYEACHGFFTDLIDAPIEDVDCDEICLNPDDFRRVKEASEES